LTEAQALAAFVAGTISFNALRNAIAESTDFIFQPNGTIHITSHRTLPTTVFRPADVERVLTRYQAGEVTIEELSVWGLVLRTLDAFELGDTDEESRDTIWDVLAHLSVASINDAFDLDRVIRLLGLVRGTLRG
jgi:hypothetical protein